jgi:hypothetical protein
VLIGKLTRTELIQRVIGKSSPLSPKVADMKDKKGRIDHRFLPNPEFYLTEKEKHDGETSRIRRWLELADRLFESDDGDPTPSAA